MVRFATFTLLAITGLIFFPAVAFGHDGHEHEAFALGWLIVPMGITTLSLIAVTVALALFKRIKPRIFLMWHKRLGILTVIAGVIHATLVILSE